MENKLIKMKKLLGQFEQLATIFREHSDTGQTELLVEINQPMLDAINFALEITRTEVARREKITGRPIGTYPPEPLPAKKPGETRAEWKKEYQRQFMRKKRAAARAEGKKATGQKKL